MRFEGPAPRRAPAPFFVCVVAAMALARAAAGDGDVESKAVAALVASAKKALAAGSLDDARRAAELALRLAPESAEARDALAKAGAAESVPAATPAPAF